MDDELLDFIPLFLREARGRLERLVGLATLVDGERAALVEARRELHTLKGACRMLRLLTMAEVCHQGEELLDAGGPGIGARLVAVLGRFGDLLEGVAREHAPVDDGAARWA